MFNVALKLKLVHLKYSFGMTGLNYNFKCHWLIELSDNKLFDNQPSDNNLANELVENRVFFKPITI